MRPGELRRAVGLYARVIQRRRIAETRPEANFFRCLSSMFHFRNVPVFNLRTMALFVIYLAVTDVTSIPGGVPVFVPLFMLTVVPTVFGDRCCKVDRVRTMAETSNTRVALTGLILTKTTGLIYVAVLLYVRICLRGSCGRVKRVILCYLIPCLIYVITLLHLVHLRGGRDLRAYTVMVLNSYVY